MLSERHLKFLAARAVAGPVIDRRGYRTVTEPGDLIAAGFPERQAKALVPGLLIPRYGLSGEPSWAKFRPDPEGRNGPPRAKYVSPGNSWNFLDALPGTILVGDIWLSAEGFIKADAMSATGMPVVAIDGVYGWRSQKDVVLGLEALAGPGRWFHVVCDSDFEENVNVATAMFRLAKWMRGEGCKVRILHPPSPGSKVGVDDFLACGGNVSQLVEAPYDEARTRVRNHLGIKNLLTGWAAS